MTSRSTRPSRFAALLALVVCATSARAEDALDTVVPLEGRLAEEVRKMIEAGHLRPAYCITPEGYINHSPAAKGKTCDFDDYWANPAETIYALVRALPHVPQGLYPGDPSKTWAEKLKGYIRGEFDAFKPYQWTHAGDGGARREVNDVPPDYRADYGGNYNVRTSPAAVSWLGWSFDPFNFYACWKYAQVFEAEEPGLAEWLLTEMRGKVAPLPVDDVWLRERPHVLNCYIAGYLGYLGLQDLAGEAPDATVTARLDEALGKRTEHLAIDAGALRGLEAGGFLYLVPELGQHLYENDRAGVARNVRRHSDLAAYWFVARAPEDTRPDNVDKHVEGGLTHYYEYWSLFNAKAYALKEGRTALEMHLDCPAVARGDLYYILNLVATIEAPGEPPGPFVAAPVIAPAGGSITGAVEVTITCATAGAVIRFTTDGSDPDEGSAAYSGPLTVDSELTLKARAYAPGLEPSDITAAHFTTAPTTADSDGDGLTDAEEASIGTDPARADTDSDGLSDYEEFKVHGTDPLAADSDGDLMPDGWELASGLDPCADDAGADPDADGFSNLDEYLAGTDPQDPGSVPAAAGSGGVRCAGWFGRGDAGAQPIVAPALAV